MNLKQFLNIFKDRHADYSEQFSRAFPRAFKSDVKKACAILPVRNRKVTLVDGRVHELDYFISDRGFQLKLRGEDILIPYRIYFNEPDIERVDELSDVQRRILNCIYLRHHNGYVREKHLKKLAGATDYFVCPFTVQLIGEYVIELLDILENLFTPAVLNNYAEFIVSNPFYWKQTKSRMTSYWGEYYRYEYTHLNEYVGRRLVKGLDVAARDFVTKRTDVSQ